MDTQQPSHDPIDSPADHRHHHHHHHHGGRHAAHAFQWSRILRHAHEHVSSFFHGLLHVPFILTLVMLGVLPIVYCGGERWWLPLAGLVLGLIYACWALAVWWCGSKHAPLRHSWCGLLFSIPLAVGLIQLIPSRSLTAWFSPRARYIWESVQKLHIGDIRYSISLAPTETLQRCGLLTICLLTFIALVSFMRHSSHVRYVLLAVILAAFGNAVIAYINAFSPSSTAFSNGTFFNGTFLNRNHFAFMMMMGIMATMGLLGNLTSSHQKHSDGSENKWFLLCLPLCIVLFILMTAQVLSLSRGAFTGTVSSLVIFLVFWIVGFRKQQRQRIQSFFAVFSIMVVSLLIALPYVLQRLSERFQTLMNEEELSLSGRWSVWCTSARLIRHFWRFGTGLGGYPSSIQPFENGEYTAHLIAHAHNDYLELASEMGVPVTAALLIMGLIGWLIALKRICSQEDKTYRWCGLGALFGILGAAIHECGEFNLLAWSNTMIFTSLVAVVAVCASRHNSRNASSLTAIKDAESERQKRHDEHELNRKRRWQWRLALIPLAVVILAGSFRFCIPRIKAGFAYASLQEAMAKPTPPGYPVKYDCESQMALVTKISACWPHDPYLLWRKSIIRAKATAYDKSQWPLLCDDIKLSMLQVPGDSQLSLQCARFLEEAQNRLEIEMDPQAIQPIFDWAAACQPTICKTILESGFAAYRHYIYLAGLGQDASEAKERAIRYLKRAIELGESQYMTVFNALADLMDDERELAAIAPKNEHAQRALLTLLINHQHFEEALNLIDRVRPLLHKEDSVIYFLETKIGLLGRLQRSEERCQAWDDLTAYTRSLAPVSRAEQLLQSGHAEDALAILKHSCRWNCSNISEIIAEAQMESILGKYDDMIQTLLRISYLQDPISPEQFEKIHSLLANGINTMRDATRTMGEFLLQVLLLKSDSTELTALETGMAIEKIEQDLAKSRFSWLQSHLVPYYAGLSWLRANQKDRAIQAFHRCLDICPMHLWTIQKLAEVAPEELNDEMNKLLAAVQKEKRPLGHPVQGILWCGFSISKPDFVQFTAEEKVTYYLLCHSDVNDHLSLSFSYSDAKGFLFKDDIQFKDGTDLTWRVGEIKTFSRKWSPVIKTLSATRRQLENGTVFVSCKNAAIPAFTILLNEPSSTQ